MQLKTLSYRWRFDVKKSLILLAAILLFLPTAVLAKGGHGGHGGDLQERGTGDVR